LKGLLSNFKDPSSQKTMKRVREGKSGGALNSLCKNRKAGAV